MQEIYTPYDSVGLKNFGNTCYINSALQMLFSIDEYREFILNSNFKNPTIASLKKIFKMMSDPKKEKYIKKFEKYIIVLFIEFNYSVNEEKIYGKQDDSEEFLSFLKSKTTNDLNFSKLYSYYDNISKYCKLVNNISNKNDYKVISYIFKVHLTKKIINLNGKLKKKIELIDLINNEFNEKKIDHSERLFRCSEKKLNTCEKTDINIPEENKYLFIQLLRMKFNKNHESYSFITDEIIINKNINLDNKEYFLLGAIVKNGGYKSGHYVYVTFKNGEIYKIYNDSSINSNNLEENGFNLNKNSYILLYKKKENINIQTHINILNTKVNLINQHILQNLEEKNKILRNEKKLTLEYIKKLQEHTTIINIKLLEDKKDKENKKKLKEILNEKKENKIKKLLKKLQNEEDIKKQIYNNEKLAKNLQNEEDIYNNEKLAKNLQNEEDIKKQIYNNEKLAKKLQNEEIYQYN